MDSLSASKHKMTSQLFQAIAKTSKYEARTCKLSISYKRWQINTSLLNIGKSSGWILKHFWALCICNPWGLSVWSHRKHSEWKRTQMNCNFFQSWEDWESLAQNLEIDKECGYFPCLLVCCRKIRSFGQLCSNEDSRWDKYSSSTFGGAPRSEVSVHCDTDALEE